MSLREERGAPIYPQYCHAQSPTIHKWVKLTAADVHALRRLPGFDHSLQLYFHLNHPIRYVYLCGAVVSIEVFPHIIILVLDDSSGRTIDVKIERLLPAPVIKPDGLETRPFAVETTVPSVRLTRSCADPLCGRDHLSINGTTVDEGATIKAKGTLERFRNQPQLKLLQVGIVPTLAEELRIWRDYAAFAHAVLARPWVLGPDVLAALERKFVRRLQRQRDRDAAAALRRGEERDHARQQTKRWSGIVQRDLARRERAWEDEEREMNGNALDRRDGAS